MKLTVKYVKDHELINKRRDTYVPAPVSRDTVGYQLQ